MASSLAKSTVDFCLSLMQISLFSLLFLLIVIKMREGRERRKFSLLEVSSGNSSVFLFSFFEGEETEVSKSSTLEEP